MPRKTSDVEKSLMKKGFRSKGGDHHYLMYFTLTGKKSAVFTKTSHGSRELGDSLLGRMAKQVCLSRAEFDQLIECPLDQASYERKLQRSGALAA
jgi:hypothetical protein